ncbi:hypothetical protein [Shinella zoogloeoides]|uniref:hypothetical protein n=1 Tax=Shinella zoogloeoides TaxID=352475 RepID=UPI00299EF256|nr:hypothetical protein [Shinella zoogloeoides]
MAGNRNSGGQNRLSDAEKKRRGTFRPDQSEAVYAARKAENVVTGVFFSEIPVPSLPLDEHGRATFQKWAKLLLDQGKLTSVTSAHCESLGFIDMLINQRVTAGKLPTADSLKQRTSVIRMLGVAEDAPIIAGSTKSRFEGSGFSNSRSSPFRLRPYRTADPGKL